MMTTLTKLAIATAGLVALAACDLPAGGAVANTSAAAGPSDVVATTAPTVQMSSRDRLIRAMEGQGCVLNTDNIGAVLVNASVTQNDILQIVPELEAEGRAEVASDGEIRILSDNCI